MSQVELISVILHYLRLGATYDQIDCILQRRKGTAKAAIKMQDMVLYYKRLNRANDSLARGTK